MIQATVDVKRNRAKYITRVIVLLAEVGHWEQQHEQAAVPMQHAQDAAEHSADNTNPISGVQAKN